jgi:hypothetical protein
MALHMSMFENPAGFVKTAAYQAEQGGVAQPASWLRRHARRSRKGMPRCDN